MQKYPENQSDVGSSGQTLTTNVSMTLCSWQICHQTHVLCGCTTFGTDLKLGTKLIRYLRLLLLGQGRGYYKGGGGVQSHLLAWKAQDMWFLQAHQRGTACLAPPGHVQVENR